MSADKRVAIFLWDEIVRTNRMTLSITHDEIARYIGSAREVVTKVLKYFAQEGAVILERGKIQVTDKELLKNISNVIGLHTKPFIFVKILSKIDGFC